MEYEGSITHNKNTIKLLFKTVYYAYNLKSIVIRIIIGTAMNILALTINMSNVIQGLLIMFGCFIIMSKDFSHNYKAQEVIDTRKGKYPIIKIKFYEDYLKIIGENGGILNYSKIDKLITKDDYFFLFVSHDVGCMIDKKTIKPSDIENFKKFIYKKTGKFFQESKGLMSITLKDLNIFSKR